MADDITFLIQTIKEIANLTWYEEISPLQAVIFALWQAHTKYIKELLLQLHQLVQCKYMKQFFNYDMKYLLILKGSFYCLLLSCLSASGSYWQAMLLCSWNSECAMSMHTDHVQANIMQEAYVTCSVFFCFPSQSLMRYQSAEASQILLHYF